MFSSLPNFETQKAYAQTDPTQSSGGESTVLPECSTGTFSFNISGCVAWGFYYIFFVPTSFLFSVSGQLMDFSMAYTLNSANYGKTSDGSSFVEKGWIITRDLSNLLFIIILMWIAIKMILGIGNDKKLLGTIIVVGLLINFSLFFARVIIDASNILGKVFYDNMGVDTGSDEYIHNPWIGEGEKSISVAIVSNFNPQKLFNQAGTLDLHTESGVVDEAAVVDAGPFIIIILIMSVINLIGMYVFFVVAFILIGRVIGLWILMIFAPIAFISYILPPGASKTLDKMHHSVWWPELMQQSFVVPIFLFFLYLILLFMNTGFLSGFKTFTNSTSGGILSVVVPLIIITMLLLKAKDIATKMSGDVGQAFSKMGSAVGGLALGGALGAYGKLGRATIGKAGERIANSETMMNMQRRGGLMGSIAGGVRSGAKATGSASFDARGVSGITGAMKGAGVTGFGESAKGGYKGYAERQDKRQKETADELVKGSVNDKTNQDTRRARRNLDVLLQTHGVELSSQEEALEKARKDFKQAKDDGYGKDDTTDIDPLTGLNVWKTKQKAVKDAEEKVTNFKEDKGIKQAGKELGQAETARKREEETRRRGQSQEIEATKPKSKEEVEEIQKDNTKRKKAIEAIKEDIKHGVIVPGTPAYDVAQKDIKNFEEGIKKSTYSKKSIWKRIGRRIVSGNEYNQTGAYGTADNQRKGLKDEKKGDDKK